MHSRNSWADPPKGSKWAKWSVDVCVYAFNSQSLGEAGHPFQSFQMCVRNVMNDDECKEEKMANPYTDSILYRLTSVSSRSKTLRCNA